MSQRYHFDRANRKYLNFHFWQRAKSEQTRLYIFCERTENIRSEEVFFPPTIFFPIARAPCLSKSEAIRYKQQSFRAPCLSKSEAIRYKQQS